MIRLIILRIQPWEEVKTGWPESLKAWSLSVEVLQGVHLLFPEGSQLYAEVIDDFPLSYKILTARGTCTVVELMKRELGALAG